MVCYFRIYMQTLFGKFTYVLIMSLLLLLFSKKLHEELRISFLRGTKTALCEMKHEKEFSQLETGAFCPPTVFFCIIQLLCEKVGEMAQVRFHESAREGSDSLKMECLPQWCSAATLSLCTLFRKHLHHSRSPIMCVLVF